MEKSARAAIIIKVLQLLGADVKMGPILGSLS